MLKATKPHPTAEELAIKLLGYTFIDDVEPIRKLIAGNSQLTAAISHILLQGRLMEAEDLLTEVHLGRDELKQDYLTENVNILRTQLEKMEEE